MGNDRFLAEITTTAAADRVLYAIPHAGAGIAAVKRTCRALGHLLDTVAVRLPGREALMNIEPFTDLDLLADALTEQVAGHAGERSVLLYGHCSGGVIGYEVARRLAPGSVTGLIVSSQEAPDRIPVHRAWTLPRPEFLALVAADGYLPEEILSHPELAELVEPALRADYQAVETHTSSMEVITAPVLALLGTQDRKVAADDVAAWARVTSGGFRLEYLPGGHNLLQDQPGEVAAAIGAAVTVGEAR